MKKRVVIKASSLPVRPPILLAAVLWLLLDRFNAPGWAFGVMWTVVAMLVAGFFIGLNRSEFRDAPGFGEK